MHAMTKSILIVAWSKAGKVKFQQTGTEISLFKKS